MATSYRVTVKGRLSEEPVQNSWVLSTTQSDNTFAEAQEIADTFNTSGIIDAYLDILSDEYHLDAIEVRGIVAAGGGTVTTAVAVVSYSAIDGTRAGDLLSNQDGPLMSYTTENAPGERARLNKTFFPGINKADATNDGVAPAVQSAIITFLTALTTAFTVSSGAVTWVALVKIAGAATIRGIIGKFVETFVASQNRRRPRST